MMFYGGGWSQKLVMIGVGIILLCIAVQMARDTIVAVFVPMVPWLIIVAVIVVLVIILKLVHEYFRR